MCICGPAFLSVHPWVCVRVWRPGTFTCPRHVHRLWLREARCTACDSTAHACAVGGKRLDRTPRALISSDVRPRWLLASGAQQLQPFKHLHHRLADFTILTSFCKVMSSFSCLFTHHSTLHPTHTPTNTLSHIIILIGFMPTRESSCFLESRRKTFQASSIYGRRMIIFTFENDHCSKHFPKHGESISLETNGGVNTGCLLLFKCLPWAKINPVAYYRRRQREKQGWPQPSRSG